MSLLTVSALAYLLARLGFLHRTRTYDRACLGHPGPVLTHTGAPSLIMIIPSYQEDARVIRRTLLTAALQEFPDQRVVLLIDDPFVPKTR